MEFSSRYYLFPNHSQIQHYLFLSQSSVLPSPSFYEGSFIFPINPIGYQQSLMIVQSVSTETQGTAQSWRSHEIKEQRCSKKPKNIRKKKNRNLQQKLNKKSARKNSQLNIINKLIYFIKDKDKSKDTFYNALKSMKITQTLQIINTFYFAISTVLGPRVRKYLNMHSLKQLMNQEYLLLNYPELTQTFQNTTTPISLQQFCSLFRRISRHFLHNTCISTILTSKRITNITLPIHIHKLRILIANLSQ